MSEETEEISSLMKEVQRRHFELVLLRRKLNNLKGNYERLSMYLSEIKEKEYKRDFCIVYIATGGMFSNGQNKVACLLARGLTSKQIADKLCICEKTVKFHKSNIYKIAKVRNGLHFISWIRDQIDAMPKDIDIDAILNDPNQDKAVEQSVVNLPLSQTHPYLSAFSKNHAEK